MISADMLVRLRANIATLPLEDDFKREWLRLISSVQVTDRHHRAALDLLEQARRNNRQALGYMVAGIVFFILGWGSVLTGWLS